MATVYLAPVGNAFNFATQGWLPLQQGKLYTYLAGSSTPKETYTTKAGNVQNDNPIILGVDGRPPSEIWLVSGFSYLFLLTDEDDNEIGSYDNLVGINDTRVISDCCPTIGDAVSGDGQAFTMVAGTTAYTDGMVVYAAFQNDQTVTAPTLNINSLGPINIVDGESGSVLAYQILTGDVIQLVFNEDDNAFRAVNLPALTEVCVGPSGQSSVLTTGTQYTMPGFPGCRVIDAWGAVATASSSGLVSLNIKEGGVSIFSTVITIDANETSSRTAATPSVISDHVIADNATITYTCDGAGTNASGPLWYMLIRRTQK